MATVFRPTKPCPLPTSPDLVTRDGKSHVRIRESGKPVFYPLTKDGTKYLKPSTKWYAKFRDAGGVVRLKPLSPNKDAAKLMLSALLKRVENEKAGVHDEYTDHRRRPLADLLAEYRRHQTDRGHTDKQADQAGSRCRRVFDGCGFALLSDLNATAAEGWLADHRRRPRAEGGFGAQTHNHYVTAMACILV
jgi:hypothetical protein